MSWGHTEKGAVELDLPQRQGVIRDITNIIADINRKGHC